MHHIAIMSPTGDLIGKILERKKTIESRWYKTRRAPWNTIKAGDWVYFKASGKVVTAKAEVKKVLQFENLTISLAHEIVEKYGKEICIMDRGVEKWAAGKNYVILIFLKNAQEISPFSINKKGFGSAAAWLTIPTIETIQI